MTIKVFDFFSGCGGTSAGLQAAGMEIAFGLDLDPDAAATFRANFPGAHFLRKDLTRLRADRVQSLISAARTNPILFCGCAPCQPFSRQNLQRKAEDSRVPLLSHFGRFVRYLRVPICKGGLSGCQTGSFDSGKVQAVAEEFDKDYGFGGSCEKLRKGMAEGNGDDLFGGCQSWPNGSNPGAE